MIGLVGTSGYTASYAKLCIGTNPIITNNSTNINIRKVYSDNFDLKKLSCGIKIQLDIPPMFIACLLHNGTVTNVHFAIAKNTSAILFALVLIN